MSRKITNKIIVALSILFATCLMAMCVISYAPAKANTEPVFDMIGASVRLTEGTTGLRFAAVVDETTAKEVSENANKTFGALIVPEDYFATYEVSKTGDVIKAFTDKSVVISYKEDLAVTENKDGDLIVECSIVNLNYFNLAREFYGIIYIKTVDGATATYDYATAVVEDTDMSVRNIYSVAGADYMAYKDEYLPSEKAIVEGFLIKGAAIQTMGLGDEEGEISSEQELEELVADITMEMVFSAYLEETTATAYMSKGYALSSYAVQDYQDQYAIYDSSDKTVATISDAGVIELLSAGQTNITVSILGFEKTLALTVVDDSAAAAVSAKIAAIGNVQATDDCLAKIVDARADYNALSVDMQELVENYDALVSAEEQIITVAEDAFGSDTKITSIENSIATYITDFEVTMANFRSYISSSTAIDSAYAKLSNVEKLAVDNYSKYSKKKASFTIVDELRDSTTTDLKANFTFVHDGYNGINNGITAPNVAAALRHPTYGDFVTIAKSSGEFGFKYKSDGLDLSAYTHVMFVVKNNVSNTTWKVGCVGRTVVSVPSGELAEVHLTVSEFLNNAVEVYFKGQGSVWISAIVAYKQSADVNEVNNMISEYNTAHTAFSLETFRADLAKVNAIDAAYAALDADEKDMVIGYDAYLANKLAVVYEMDSDISNKVTGWGGYSSITSNVTTQTTNASYAYCASIGVNTNADKILKFKDKEQLDLSGYTYVSFGIRNGLSSDMTLYLFANNAKGDVIIENVPADMAANGTYVTVTLTVEQFLNNDFNMYVSASGNIWITAVVAHN